MKLTLLSLNNAEEIDNVVSISEIDGVVVFSTSDQEQYNLANDFPTVYRIEISDAVKPRKVGW